MLSKNKIKYLRSLKLAKFRQMYNNFVVEGEKMALELLRAPNIEIESIVCTQDWSEKQGHLLKPFAQRLFLAKEKDMEAISSLKTATDVFIVVKQPKHVIDHEAIDEQISLYLEDIQNPGNLGTILRIADWFGIRNVFCSAHSADLYNPKVVQSTMGAFLRVTVIEMDFETLKQGHPQLPVYGTVLEGEDLFKTDLATKGIIVIGSEGKGISPDLKKHITHPITIPAHAEGGAESLNAAVAAGIVCAAFRNL